MRIGREYKESFESAVKLINSGLLKDSSFFNNNYVYFDGPRNTICFNQQEFQLDEIGSATQRENKKATFTEEGSSWFESVRNPEIKNENADWISFLENLALTYHKEYSISVQRQKPNANVKKKREEATEIVKNVIKNFFAFSEEQLNVSDIEIKKEYVFGLSLRLDVCGNNAPEPKPVLCKVYFTKNEKGEIYPLTKEEAETIIQSCDVETSGSEENVKNQEETNAIINESLGALEKLINDSNRGASHVTNFRDYMCCNAIDEKVMKDIHARSAHDNLDIDCRRVAVLGIIHVEWYRYLMVVSLGNMPIFKMTINEDASKINLECANCRMGKFVLNNVVKYQEGGFERTTRLNVKEENFGLTDSIIQAIKESKTFQEHLILVECNIRQRNNKRCTNIVCGSQAIRFLEDGVYKCKDCDYPEIIYTDKEGKKHFTETLGFACDQKELIPAEDIALCPCCGRGYDRRTHTGGSCEICDIANKLAKNAFSEEQAIKYKKAYKESAYMFHPVWRFFHMFEKKYCVEDNEMMVFVVKNKKYVFDKLSSIGDYGYIAGPKRVDNKKRK